MLEIKNISKKYQNEKEFILDNVSMRFYDRELSVIIGESGSGKSSLMNILGGLDLDYSGELYYSYKKLTKENIDDYRKNNIGFIFQSFNLLSHLTAYENVALALKLKSKYDRKKVIKVFKDLDIYDLMNKKPNEMSGGQKQRVAIARAIVNDPDIIFADEPTGALDSKNSIKIMEILSYLAKKGKIVIVVTHSEKVAKYADKIIEVKDSKLRIIKQLNFKTIFDITSKENKKRKIFSLISLSINNLKRNLKRNLLIIFATSIGIFCISFMLYLNSGIKKYINKEININFNPKELEVNKTQNALEQSFFTKTDIERIKNIRHVEKVNTSTTISNSSTLSYNNKNYEIISLSSFKKYDKKRLKEGNETGLLISETLSKKIKVNDYVDLYIIENSKPKILHEELLVTGIIKNDNNLFDNMNYVYIPDKILSDLYDINNLELKATSLNLYVDNKDNMKEVKQSLKQKGFYYSNSSNMIDKIYNYVDIISIILITISSISLLVSFIMIFIIMQINVVERTKEIGILKSLGMKSKEIKKVFLYESALIGLIAGLTGSLFSSFLSIIANVYTKNNYKSVFLNINIKFIIISVLVSILISSRAGLKPSKKASKLDPIESLRYE